MTPPRISLVLNGGAEDGPWLAGAALETLAALEAADGEAGLVDVIVGGDAGALAAAVAARALSVNRTLLPFLEKLWIEALDADVWYGSPAGANGARRRASLDEITRALVTADPARDDEPSPAAGDALRVGILTGRAETFDLDVPAAANDPLWEGLRAAAVGPDPDPLAGGRGVGGDPRALARRLGRRESEDGARVVISVDAGDAGGEGEGDGEAGRSDAAARAAWFDALVARLPEIADGLCDPQALGLGHIVTRIAEDIARHGAAGGSEDEALDRLDAAVAGIQTDPRYADMLEAVDTRAGRTRLAKLIYVLDGIAGVDRATEMSIRVPRGPAEGRARVLFDPAARARELAAGRRSAARALRSALDGLSTPTDPTVERPTIRPPDGERVTRTTLDAFVDRETRALLDAVPVGGFRGALGWLWKPAAREWVRELARRRLDGAG